MPMGREKAQESGGVLPDLFLVLRAAGISKQALNGFHVTSCRELSTTLAMILLETKV